MNSLFKSRPRQFAAPLLLAIGIAIVAPTRVRAQDAIRRFDFGSGTKQPATRAVNGEAGFSEQLGYGWLDATGLVTRDRKKNDDLRDDLVMGKTPHTFRIAGLAPGRYLLKVVSGDTDYGDHVTRVEVAGAGEWPLLVPTTSEFVTLAVSVQVQGPLDISFSSPAGNWVVNALSLEPTQTDMQPLVTRETVKAEPLASTWEPIFSQADPTKPLLDAFKRAAKPTGFTPTGLNRAAYLSLISGEVDFWKKHQNASGAIIDPYRKEEWQYSTPAFAQAAAALVAWNNRADLLESAAKAMDWSTRTLADRRAASKHEDFFPPMLAHTLMLLKPRVAPERAARWEADIRRIEPSKIYRMAPGANNWNIVALSGEALFQKMGLRDKADLFVTNSLAAQGRHFGSPYGLYLEGPMPYDHFPRLWLADLIGQGYNGPYLAQVEEALRRAALTSLFMQSPWGELPAGGRSAHHQWNEAEQCVTYEVFAARALRAGDANLAGVYKRAAHLALASMRRWVRPSGEMQIIKNWVDPAQGHAYEAYSAHSQYNLLPMAMLALAYEHAGATQNVAEQPAPADVGGFVLQVPQLHKVLANAGGTYVELDTAADHHYDATGLIRVHLRGVSPQLGPSDSILEAPVYKVPAGSPKTANTGVGVSWQDAGGQWRRLGELSSAQIKAVRVTPLASAPQRMAFDVIYEGDLFGVQQIIEHYVLTPGKVELTSELAGYNGPLRYVWPVLADDGRNQSTITVNKSRVTVSQPGTKTAQSFEALGAATVRVENERYPNHNGWARLGVAEYPRGGKITLLIQPQ